jgi:hypothetical protein
MSTVKKVVLVACAVSGLAILASAKMRVADAQIVDRNGVISDALRNGAHVVQCENNRCQDQTTMEYLDHNQPAADGVYLVYPNTPDATSNVDRTRDAVKSIGQ